MFTLKKRSLKVKRPEILLTDYVHQVRADALFAFFSADFFIKMSLLLNAFHGAEHEVYFCFNVFRMRKFVIAHSFFNEIDIELTGAVVKLRPALAHVCFMQ